MKTRFHIAHLGGAAALALCISAATASAQTGAAAPTRPADGAKADGRGMVVRKDDGMGGGWMRRDRAEMEKRAADHLRTMLQLTPAQEPALQAFLAAMKRPESMGPQGGHRTAVAQRDGAGGDTDKRDKIWQDREAQRVEMEQRRAAEMAMTTPQRLDAMIKHMAQRQAEVQAHVEAVKRFYAALSPSQQKVFDTLQSGMRRGGRWEAHTEGGPGPHWREMHVGMTSSMPPARAMGER